MPIFSFTPDVRLTINVPEHGSDRFMFSGEVVRGGISIPLSPQAVAALVPEVASYVHLHDCYRDGSPFDVRTRAWFLAGGILSPGAPGTSLLPQERCEAVLRELLRMHREEFSTMITKLIRLGAEFNSDPRILRPVLMDVITSLCPRWEEEANKAIDELVAVLTRAGTPAPHQEL